MKKSIPRNTPPLFPFSDDTKKEPIFRTTLILPCFECKCDILPNHGIITIAPRTDKEINLHTRCYSRRVKKYGNVGNSFRGIV